MSDIGACEATDPNELRRQLLNASVPKSGREHWAARHIKQIEREKEGLAELLSHVRDLAEEWRGQAERGLTGDEARRCLGLVRGGNATKSTAELLEWLAERLVHQYGENAGVDFVLACKTRATMLRDAERSLTPVR